MRAELEALGEDVLIREAFGRRTARSPLRTTRAGRRALPAVWARVGRGPGPRGGRATRGNAGRRVWRNSAVQSRRRVAPDAPARGAGGVGASSGAPGPPPGDETAPEGETRETRAAPSARTGAETRARTARESRRAAALRDEKPPRRSRRRKKKAPRRRSRRRRADVFERHEEDFRARREQPPCSTPPSSEAFPSGHGRRGARVRSRLKFLLTRRRRSTPPRRRRPAPRARARAAARRGACLRRPAFVRRRTRRSTRHLRPDLDAEETPLNAEATETERTLAREHAVLHEYMSRRRAAAARPAARAAAPRRDRRGARGGGDGVGLPRLRARGGGPEAPRQAPREARCRARREQLKDLLERVARFAPPRRGRRRKKR